VIRAPTGDRRIIHGSLTGSWNDASRSTALAVRPVSAGVDVVQSQGAFVCNFPLSPCERICVLAPSDLTRDVQVNFMA